MTIGDIIHIMRRTFESSQNNMAKKVAKKVNITLKQGGQKGCPKGKYYSKNKVAKKVNITLKQGGQKGCPKGKYYSKNKVAKKVNITPKTRWPKR